MAEISVSIVKLQNAHKRTLKCTVLLVTCSLKFIELHFNLFYLLVDVLYIVHAHFPCSYINTIYQMFNIFNTNNLITLLILK